MKYTGAVIIIISTEIYKNLKEKLSLKQVDDTFTNPEGIAQYIHKFATAAEIENI